MPITDLISAVKHWQTLTPTYNQYHAYYNGNHELRYVTETWRQVYGQIIKDSRENICPAIVAAFTDRIQIESWGDDTDNETAKNLQLDLIEDMANREAFCCGDAYLAVWELDGTPKVEFVPADQMMPVPDPLDPNRLELAARIWISAENNEPAGRADLYYPNRVERYTTTVKVETVADMPTNPDKWVAYTDEVYGPVVAHNFGQVPVCWLRQAPQTQTGHGRSILADVIPLQDELNQIRANLTVITQAYSTPFWILFNHQTKAANAPNPFAASAEFADALGGETKTSGTRVGFNTGTDEQTKLIHTTDGAGPIVQLTPPDLTDLLAARTQTRQAIAAVAGIPPYYFTPTSGDVPSGESLRVLSARLTAAVVAYQQATRHIWAQLKTLLGMSNEPIRFAEAMPLDVTERVTIAEAKKALGYALTDAIDILDEPDHNGVIERANQTVTDTGQALLAGALTYQP